MKNKKKADSTGKINSKDFYRFWNSIEKKAFSPEGERSIGKWLSQFILFLGDLFEKQDRRRWIKLKPQDNVFSDEITFELPGISCSFKIPVNLSKFSFLVKWKEAALQFEYDNNYTCEFDYLEEHCINISPDFTKDQLKKVLENKIHHPALHYHMKGKGKIPGKNEEINIPHNIHIGLVTKNPFLFLYQLSYQFLYGFGDKKEKKGDVKRQQELERLADIIFENKGKDKIGPGLLFEIKK